MALCARVDAYASPPEKVPDRALSPRYTPAALAQGAVRVRLLGPVEATVDGRAVPVPNGRPAAVLALLALVGGRPVGIDALADGVWGDRPPRSARASLATLVVRLRHALGVAAIRTVPPGYALAVAPSDVDALEFRALLRSAGAAAPAAAVGLLDTALALWQGEALAGPPGDVLAGHAAALAHALGRLDEAVDLLERSLDQCRALGNRPTEAEGLYRLAAVHRDRGDLAATTARATEPLDLAESLEHRSLRCDALREFGAIDVRRGEPAAAAGSYEQALAPAREVANRHQQATVLCGLSGARLGPGRPDEAAADADAAARIARECDYRLVEAAARTARAAADLLTAVGAPE
jgi:tetratricopeptide (TPR) repeat protein